LIASSAIATTEFSGLKTVSWKITFDGVAKTSIVIKGSENEKIMLNNK
jgi:hypothetical protein